LAEAKTAAGQKPARTPHSLILENRASLTATGVSNVESFDDQTVVAKTDLGDLTVHGEKLHIDRLNLESGELTLDGEISSVSYSEIRSAGGFFNKLFK
jgi:sporulation protein YabP